MAKVELEKVSKIYAGGVKAVNAIDLCIKDQEFVVLVGIAFCLAAPIAWVFLHRWLQAYEYRVSLPVWVFAAAGLGGLVITLLTVSGQAIRAAGMNPVDALRSE